MDFDTGQYVNLFVEESNEYLQNMNEILLELEKDISNISLINEMFRIAHTLKGMSGTMGFSNMADLTHEMENVLDSIRNEKLLLDGDIVDVLFECFDTLDEAVNYIANNGKENDSDNSELIRKLKAIVNKDNKKELRSEGKKNEAKDTINKDEVKDTINNEEINLQLDEYVLNIIDEASKKNLNAFNIHITLSSNCMLKSARAFVIFNTLEPFGDIIYSNPSTEDIEDEKFDFDFSLIYVTQLDKESLIDKLNQVSEVEKVQIDKFETELAATKEVEINNNIDIDKVSNSKAEKIIDNSSTKNNSNKVGKTVRVDIDKLDNLMNLVSELIIIKNRMEDLSATSNKEDTAQVIEYLERITTNLNDAVMKVRMVPVERVFNRFPRMVRDLSKDLNKKVSLHMFGENTEVDRTVIDEIGDPLMHIIRNSIDHGIEKPEDRVKLGKPEEGNIVLKAYPDGNNVVIEVSDDGSGIDFDKVRDKSVKKGLISKDEADKLNEEELKNLLFEPGFSTSDKITEISGRGVGLDVVKNKVESVNGNVELESEKNKGTKFIIRIPLTLAIIQALLIGIQDEIYAIPLSSIIEVISVDKESIRNIQGQEIMLYRGKTIPVVRLDKLIGIDFNDSTDEFIGVVVRKGKKQAVLLVTRLIGQQEIVIKSLGKYLSNIKYFSGATILGNGNISLILDVNSIL